MLRIHSQAFAAATKGLAFLHRRRRFSQDVHLIFRRAAAAERNPSRSRRALSVALVVSLLATSTPAAPQTMIGVGTEWKAGLAFWMRANGLPAKLRQALTGQNPPRPRTQESQEDREARVTRIQIYPGDVTISLDDRVSFAAVAYDLDGAAVGGIRIKWTAQDTGRSRVAPVSRLGDFEAKLPGTFRITAEAAGRTAQATVIVLPSATRRRPNDPPLSSRRVSTRDLPSVTSVGSATGEKQPGADATPQASKRGLGVGALRTSARSKSGSVSRAGERKLRAHASMPLLPEDGWNDSNYWSADDPGNGVGNPPGGPLDGGAGSGNFQLAAPVLGLPGRGIDISLGLAYNSRVWNKAGTQINFDIDRDWPAPGWSLGFGKIVSMGISQGSMLIDADGTRHAFGGLLTNYGSYQHFAGHTTDGTFIDYTSWLTSAGVVTSAQARLANGTVIDYNCQGLGGVFPTRITDPNGNYITITYVNNTGPRIQTVTDTLGRVINFYYDASNLLTAITTPGLGGGTRTLVRLHYRQLYRSTTPSVV